MSSIYVGETMEAQALYKEGGATLIDPGTLVVTVTAPNGVAVNYTYGTDSQVTRLSLGTYLCRVAATAAGGYKFLFTFTTGGVVDIEAIKFQVLTL